MRCSDYFCNSRHSFKVKVVLWGNSLLPGGHGKRKWRWDISSVGIQFFSAQGKRVERNRIFDGGQDQWPAFWGGPQKFYVYDCFMKGSITSLHPPSLPTQVSKDCLGGRKLCRNLMKELKMRYMDLLYNIRIRADISWALSARQGLF